MRNNLQNYTEVIDQRKEGRKSFLLLSIAIWLIFSNLFAITEKEDLFNYFLTLLIFFLIIVIPVLILVVWGLKKVKSIITDKKIEFYIGKSLYFKIYWKNLEYINIFSEKYYDKKRKVKTSYVIEFIGSEIEKIVRLWCFPFGINKQELIISSIKNSIYGMNKPEIIENPLNDEIKIQSVECNEIDNFKSKF